jgi:hypothetical protein
VFVAAVFLQETRSVSWTAIVLVVGGQGPGVSMTQSCVRVTPMMTVGDGPTRDGRRGLLGLLVEPLRAEGDQSADPERR